MIHKVFSRLGLVAALTVLASGAHAQTREASSSGELLDRVAATVNEGPSVVTAGSSLVGTHASAPRELDFKPEAEPEMTNSRLTFRTRPSEN